MTYRTVILSSFEKLRNFEPGKNDDYSERERRLQSFPFAVMLQMSFPEIDYTTRLCWQKFGSAHGECTQHYSEYPVCKITDEHCHIGRWAKEFFVKTEYDFGFCEWYFAMQTDYEEFGRCIPEINWGEKFPK